MATIRSVIESSGLSVPAFASKLGIPYRTVQDWYYGERNPPQYVVDLIIYRLNN